ncbi:MAG: DUF58 domain-containing protein [Lachnospiraceae bacterium]|nr:DUF58 domain-containing protein [Lachnospiraceae bacterium]HBV81905.1 hypothetical protein [Lachnospiraceae bacterium]
MTVIPDTAFFDRLSRLRLAMRHRASMNLTGNRKSIQKGSSIEFSDFREYMPGDDIRRIDWNAYGRLDRLYVKEYMEEKEAVVSILLDTSASMNYGIQKKSEYACMLTAAFAYMGLNNMDRVILYDLQQMQLPFMVNGIRSTLPRLTDWLSQRTFDGKVDICESVRQLPMKGPGVTIIISDFLQEALMESSSKKELTTVRKLLRLLDYRKQRIIFLHVLAGEELFARSAVALTGTRNLIDMEEKSTLRLTLDTASIRVYEQALQEYLSNLRQECARMGAFYAVCNTETDIYQQIFQELRALYDF